MTFLIFILGTIFGSFSNLVINRKIRSESIVYPPSHCDSCNHRLYPRDLIPIFSFIFLRGKCRYCKSTIPRDNILIEILAGLIFIQFFDFTYPLKSLLILIAMILSMIIAMIDLRSFDIYMSHIGVLFIVGIIYRYNYLEFDSDFFVKVLGFIFLYLLVFILSKAGLGDGDIYFYLALFLFIENKYLWWFVLGSIWLGAIFAVFIARKHQTMKLAIPFCIYIFMSFVIIMSLDRLFV